MLDEDKIREMTRLAAFEKKKGAQTEIASQYYKNDYVSYHMIWTAIATTIAYLLLVALYIFCRLEYFVEHLQQINIISSGISLVVGYFVFLVVFEVIGYFVYSRRYRKAQENLKEYCAELKQLEKIYNKEHLRQTRATIQRNLDLGGTVSNDDIIGN